MKKDSKKRRTVFSFVASNVRAVTHTLFQSAFFAITSQEARKAGHASRTSSFIQPGNSAKVEGFRNFFEIGADGVNGAGERVGGEPGCGDGGGGGEEGW